MRMRDPHLCSWELESATEIELLLENTYTNPSAALSITFSIPCISDQCILLLNQPSAQYKIRINSRGTTATYFGKNIPSSGNICVKFKKSQNIVRSARGISYVQKISMCVLKSYNTEHKFIFFVG
jgi:hypothetical protein